MSKNVLRFKDGYLNKSHYQYADAVFTSHRERGGGGGGVKGEHEEKSE